MEPYYSDDQVTIYHGDCREILSEMGGVDAIVTDPPYGIGLNTNYGSRGRSGARALSNDYGESMVGDSKPFDPSHLLGFPLVVLFGANHYADKLPPSQTWLVWDKLHGLSSKRDVGFNDQADVEMAWVNKGGPARLFSHRWMGLLKGSEQQDARLHPTQKPVRLMKWVIQAVAKDAAIICDPYAGSGSTLRAAKDLGRKAIGIEISEKYCEIAAKRCSQEVLFGAPA